MVTYASSMLLLLVAILPIFLHTTNAQTGVCYGMMGNNLPPANEVIALYKANNIRRLRLYDPNQAALNALRDSGIEVILGVPNSDLQHLNNPSDADWWVDNNVLKYYPSVRIKYIAVGNEVSPIGYTKNFAPFVLPAIQNIYQKLRRHNLHDQIKVSTAIDTTLIGVSYPPSKGTFRDDVKQYLAPIIGYMAYAQAPLLANIYTYFSYLYNPRDISLSYATLSSNQVLVWDGSRGYTNLFDAMLDGLYSALETMGGGPSVGIVVSESGWPSAGENGATEQNARAYYTNLVRNVKRGTPKKPGQAIETYLFALFDENQKTPEYEKHFGVFYPNKQAKYNLNFGAERGMEVSDERNTTGDYLRSDI